MWEGKAIHDDVIDIQLSQVDGKLHVVLYHSK